MIAKYPLSHMHITNGCPNPDCDSDLSNDHICWVTGLDVIAPYEDDDGAGHGAAYLACPHCGEVLGEIEIGDFIDELARAKEAQCGN